MISFKGAHYPKDIIPYNVFLCPICVGSWRDDGGKEC